MTMTCTPAQLLFLLSVAIVIAFLVASELITPYPHAYQRHSPRPSRDSARNPRLIAEAIRRIAPD